MKFVEGDDWKEELPKLSEAENIDVLLKVADAISFTHSRNIIHRDLKPSNIRLGKFGEVLVMDWGLAARLDARTIAARRHADVHGAGNGDRVSPLLERSNSEAVGKRAFVNTAAAAGHRKAQ